MTLESNLTRKVVTGVYNRLFQTDEEEEHYWKRSFSDKCQRYYDHGISDWEMKKTKTYYKSLYKDVILQLNVKNFSKKRIMEFGCGSGLLTLLMACNGADVYLLDTLEEALECCRQSEKKLREEYVFKGSVHYVKASFWDDVDVPTQDLVHNEGVVEEMPVHDALRLVERMCQYSHDKVMVGVPNFLNPYLISLWKKYGKTSELYYNQFALRNLLRPYLDKPSTFTTSLIHPNLMSLPFADFLGRKGLGFLHLGYGTVKHRQLR